MDKKVEELIAFEFNNFIQTHAYQSNSIEDMIIHSNDLSETFMERLKFVLKDYLNK